LGSSSTALAARFPKMAIICSMLSMPHPLTPSRTEPTATTERKISANTKRKMLAGGHIRFDSPQLLLRSRGISVQLTFQKAAALTSDDVFGSRWRQPRICGTGTNYAVHLATGPCMAPFARVLPTWIAKSR